MADLKISQLTALTSITADSADVVPVVDTSATTTKKISLADIVEFVLGSGSFTSALDAAGSPVDSEDAVVSAAVFS
jgi:hypothetical protein